MKSVKIKTHSHLNHSHIMVALLENRKRNETKNNKLTGLTKQVQFSNTLNKSKYYFKYLFCL